MRFKIFLLASILFLFASCKKNDIIPAEDFVRVPVSDSAVVYATSILDSISVINKTTSWYNTNKSFDVLFDERKSMYSCFELMQNNTLKPYNYLNIDSYNPSKNYYWFGLGSYLYTDLTGDGKKDLWAYFWKSPWPTNARGLHFFSDSPADSGKYDIQIGLTAVRKIVLADFDNDKKNEVVLFSTGYDSIPFPGDSIAIFHANQKRYQYLSADLGYFQGGTAGDINGDGLVDIVAYSGGSKTVPIHPTAYINKGNNSFQLSNQIFKGFTQTRDDNYYTMELFDINGDGALDLFLGAREKLRIVLNKSGSFNKANIISVPVPLNLELMDIAFLDFDSDGRTDILTMNNKDLYHGFGLRLYLNRGSSFIDVTKQYFDVYEESGKNAWIKWIHLFDYDKDGDLDIVADGFYGELYNNNTKIYWKNTSGFFTMIKR